VNRGRPSPGREVVEGRWGGAGSLVLVVAGLSWVVSCGSGPPVGGSFTVDFPTIGDAVATDTVQVFAYAYGTATSCQALFEARMTTSMSPPGSVAETPPTSPCELRQGMGTLAIPFGSYSFLAVGQAGGSDLFIGCAAQVISDVNSVVAIPLTLASNMTPVRPTSCESLASFCSKGCK
jgi:hypothetical protein